MLNGEGRESRKSSLKEVLAARVAGTPSSAKDITEVAPLLLERARAQGEAVSASETREATTRSASGFPGRRGTGRSYAG